MWRSFLLVGDQRPPVIMSGRTLVHEMYFYVVFAAILALRAPPLAGVIIWSLIILGVAATWPQYVMTSPVLQVVTSPLTFEFIMGVVIGVLCRAVLLAFPDRGALASIILFIVGFAACNIAGALCFIRTTYLKDV